MSLRGVMGAGLGAERWSRARRLLPPPSQQQGAAFPLSANLRPPRTTSPSAPPRSSLSITNSGSHSQCANQRASQLRGRLGFRGQGRRRADHGIIDALHGAEPHSELGLCGRRGRSSRAFATLSHNPPEARDKRCIVISLRAF